MSRPIKLVVLLLFVFLPTSNNVVFATSNPEKQVQQQTKAKVMMMGLFHFGNPGKDVVKTDIIDVSTPENQAYLEALAKRIQQFAPTKVLLEYNPENQALMQQRYNDYRSGKYTLGINEIYQIGFRVAKLAGLETIHSFDERNVAWLAGPMFDYMKSSDKANKNRFDTFIKMIENQQNQEFATLSLKELLIKYNQKETDDLNKSLYIMTNEIQRKDNFYGADASASWWHRNFRMYAKIQIHAQPGERVLAIAGQGHTAILKDFLALDDKRVFVDVKKYF